MTSAPITTIKNFRECFDIDESGIDETLFQVWTLAPQIPTLKKLVDQSLILLSVPNVIQN
jgi:hypothetical protein